MDGEATCVDSNRAKRGRDDSGEVDESAQPGAKRVHPADRILFDILEDVDSGDRVPTDPAAAGDLATVMRSFEEEIAALSPCPAAGAAGGTGQSDLGFLLEASDDDLGLPPTLPLSSDEGEVVDGDAGEGGGRGLEGLGNLWAFDDEDRSCYEALGFGRFAPDDGAAGGDGEVVVDGDLFGYADVAPSVPSEFPDLSWLPEFLPAV